MHGARLNRFAFRGIFFLFVSIASIIIVITLTITITTNNTTTISKTSTITISTNYHQCQYQYLHPHRNVTTIINIIFPLLSPFSIKIKIVVTSPAKPSYLQILSRSNNKNASTLIESNNVTE